jgi:hypothetical protein
MFVFAALVSLNFNDVDARDLRVAVFDEQSKVL